MASWKTTLGGILSAAGLLVAQVPGKYSAWGNIIAAAGILLVGTTAKDSNVTGGTKQQ